jgi:hypothetical protein
VGSGQSATGQQHLARQTSTEAPEDFLADIGLEPIASQSDPALRLGQAPQPCRVLQGQGAQCVVALQQIGHRAGRHSETALPQRLLDGRHPVVVGIARRADAGQDIEAKRVLGQGQAPCHGGPVRCAPLGTRRIEAAPNLEGEPHHGLQGRDGAIVVLGGPHGLTAAGTMAHHRLQRLRQGGGRAGCRTSPRYHLQLRGSNDISMASHAL